MVGRIGTDDPAPTCCEPGYSQGDFVCFRSCAAEDDTFNRIIVSGDQAFSVVEYRFMQVAAVNIQGVDLAGDSLYKMGVAVPHAGHIVVQVHIAPPGLVVHVNAFATYQLHGFFVEQSRSLSKQVVPAIKKS